VPFAAKFGYTEQDLEDSDIENRLFEEYARVYGYEAEGSWILVVHADDTSEFFPFDDPADMWCCDQRGTVLTSLAAETIVSPPPRLERP
jgi:hypothetical protein